MSDSRYEQSGSTVLFWVLWGGLGFATVGEVVLFTLMGAGAHGSEEVGQLPLSQFVVVGVICLTMVGLAALVKVREVGGGGLATAMISWMLLKSVAISGLVVYQLAHNSAYYWPFLVVFGLGMAVLNPTAFED